MNDTSLFNAFSNEGVAKGLCVILHEEDRTIFYAGPLKTAPSLAGGKVIVMHPEDFLKLKKVVNKGRH